MAQSSVKGILLNDDSSPLPYATVHIKNLQKAVYTDEKGIFEIKNIPTGTHNISFSFIGYITKNLSFTIKNTNEENDLGQISLISDATLLDEVVITGSMKPTYIKDSPVKTEVFSSEFLQEHTAPTSLAESVFLINGTQEVIGCGICYTNSISINGLPGANTAILLDGMPIYGNLASVYGLNSIPNSLIDRIEVIKGPSSTLYGSEATAGVINVITKNTKKADRIAWEVKGTQNNEAYANAYYTFTTPKVDVMLGGNYSKLASFNDRNNDAFSDVVHLDQYGAFSKLSFHRKSKKRFDLALKYYYEDRRNGIDDYLKNRIYRQLRGNDSIYGESIYTHRLELLGSYELATTPHLRLDYSLSYHDQNSFYGADAFNANQKIAFANLIYNKALSKHDFLAGLTNRYQFYDDNTFATADDGAEKQYIPGIFIQDQFLLSDSWTLLAGTRLDHYGKHGFIVSPRLNVKKKLGDWTTLRFNTGTGFRVVNLFTEDHTILSGQTEVIFDEALKPERSYNATLNLNHLYTLGTAHGSIDLDLFYTYYTNQIIADYGTVGEVHYDNLDGYAISRGISINTTYKSKGAFSMTMAGTLLSAFEKNTNEEGQTEKSKIPFSGSWSLLNTIKYKFKKPKILLTLTTKVVGPVNLNIEIPDNEPARPTTSEPYMVQTVQLSKQFSSKWQCYMGVENLLNYTQRFSPLYGTNGSESLGFSENFGTDYAYGPLEGRKLYLGIRFHLGQSK